MIPHPRLPRLLPALLAALAMSAACGDSPTDPTDPGPQPTTELFSSTIGPNGSVTRSFVTANAGTVSVSLISLSVADRAMVVGLGTLGEGGVGCTVTAEVTTMPSATDKHIVRDLAAGTYCARVADSGVLDPGPTSFTIQILWNPPA